MRLICFGDSWTAGHGVEEDVKYKEDAHPPVFIQNLRNQNSWPRWLSELIRTPFVNMGVCGYGNQYIYECIKDCVENNFIEKNDIVIVILSYPYRYKDNHDVIKIYNNMEKILRGFKHFYFNSFYPTFKEENFDIEKLPDYFINPNETLSDILKEYEIENDVSIWEYNSRSVWNDKKNYWEGDYHPNLHGYKLLASYIYEKIIEKI